MKLADTSTTKRIPCCFLRSCADVNDTIGCALCLAVLRQCVYLIPDRESPLQVYWSKVACVDSGTEEVAQFIEIGSSCTEFGGGGGGEEEGADRDG